MLLAQSRCWRVELTKEGAVVIAPVKDGLPEDLAELRELRVTVPLDRWNPVVKHVQTDRKLLGGLLLDFANTKESVATVVARDRLWVELAGVVLEATAALVTAERLVLRVPERSQD